MIFDQSFDHAYECRLIDAPPTGGVPMYCYPGAIVGGWVRGVGVEITPHSDAKMWIGSFADGGLSPNAASAVVAHPSLNQLLVVAKGDGYVVNVDDPTQFVCIDKILPIMGVLLLPDVGLILLYDFTRMVAIGANGIAWETPRLSWDGLTIEAVRAGVVHGFAWDSPNHCNVPFEVIASSGNFKGGASPELLRVKPSELQARQENDMTGALVNWSELQIVCNAIHTLLYDNQDSAAAKAYLPRLKIVVESIADDDGVITGAEAFALYHELNNNLSAALTYRMRELELMNQLYAHVKADNYDKKTTKWVLAGRDQVAFNVRVEIVEALTKKISPTQSLTETNGTDE